MIGPQKKVQERGMGNFQPSVCISHGANENPSVIRPVARGGAGGARAPPEIFSLELNSATKVEFFY